MATKLYTRQGDQGQTQMGKKRMGKDELLPAVIGAIDELSAFLGWAKIQFPSARRQIHHIQKNLQTINSLLAGYPVKFSAKEVEKLEKWIDQVWGDRQLSHFIVSGRNEAEARLQIARTVCRRAERQLVALAKKEKVPPLFLVYLNRLSDYLFALAVTAGKV